MNAECPEGSDRDGSPPRPLPRQILVLGVISLLTAMSSAMVYGLLPVFLVRVLGVTMASVGLIEGIAEAMTSFTKIIAGYASDQLGRRKPLVLLGYAVSAVNRLPAMCSPCSWLASSIALAKVCATPRVMPC